MGIGFIGTGAITTAIVTGLCTAGQGAESIWISPRNKEKSAQLQNDFPHIYIGQSNQDVVDNTDIIVLAFLPKDRSSILQSLSIRDDQIVVNLLSGTKNAEIAADIASRSTIIRAVPLPYAAEHIGPIVVYPANDKVDQIFANLGTVISVDREDHLETLSVITALMAPYFEMLANITDWATETGVNHKQAADYTTSMFEALSILARKTPSGDLHQLADESMTPGGLNELARKTINQSGGYQFLLAALQAVAERVKGL